MTRPIRNITLLILPFLGMVIINELVRPTIVEKRYHWQGVNAINSAIKAPAKCSWHCHHDSNYCKENHVKLLSQYFTYTDRLYFGIIQLLAATGSYRPANIFFLVFLIPLLLYYLLIKSLDLQKQINHLKSRR